MWKTTANLQEMIGKRPAGIPSNDASDAEWDNFYKAVGRPDKPEYTFNDPEGLPEGFDTASYKQAANEILFAAGLNQKQADKVYKAFLANEIKGAAALKEQAAAKQKELDAEFEALSKEHFGDKYDAYVETMNKAVSQYTPQSLKEAYGALADQPKVLAAVASTIKGMQDEIDRTRKEYGAEGSITSGSQITSGSIADIRAELSKLRVSPEARDFTNKAVYDKTNARIQELSAAVDRYYKS